MRKILYIFGLLTDADIDWMARVGARRRVKNGDTLIEEGKATDSIILLLEGQLSVTAKDVGLVARLGVGEVVGEMSLVDSVLPSANVAAEGECRVLRLNKDVLLSKIESDVGFGCRFYKAMCVVLADRLRQMGQQSNSNEELDLGRDIISKDELDPAILDNVWMAGERFDRLLRVLEGS